MTDQKRGVIAPDNVQKALKSEIEKHGTYKVSKTMEISREALARTISGLPIRAATLFTITAKLGLEQNNEKNNS